MILFINVFLTSKRLSVFDRGLFEPVDALAAFRYMLRSLTDLPFSRGYIFAELDPDDYGAADADLLASEVQALFAHLPQLEFRPQRLLQLQAWQRFLTDTLLPQRRPIFYSGNHDHIFVDKDCTLLNACVRQFEQLAQQGVAAGMPFTQWADYFSYRTRISQATDAFFVHSSNYRDAIQIVTPELLRKWFFDDAAHGHPEAPIRRTEDIGWVGKDYYLQLMPGRELFRHIDASSFFGVRLQNVPPLRIPPGLLEGNFKLAYLAEHNVAALRELQRAGYFCVSPYFNYRAVDEDGVDFKWLPEDVPAYMRRAASEFIQIGQRDPVTETALRDQAVAAMFSDMLHVDAPTLARLAPMAMLTRPGNSLPQLAPQQLKPRRDEGWFVLRTHACHKPAALLCVELSPSLLQPATRQFWRQLDGQQLNRSHVWAQERRSSIWHVPASAPHVAGELYPLIDGMYDYLFDFGPNLIAALRMLLPEIRADRLLLIDPQAIKAVPELADWCNRAATFERPTLLLAQTGQQRLAIGLSVPTGWLAEVLATNPSLYAGETMSLLEVLLLARQTQGELDLHVQLLAGEHEQLKPPFVRLLQFQ